MSGLWEKTKVAGKKIKFKTQIFQVKKKIRKAKRRMGVAIFDAYAAREEFKVQGIFQSTLTDVQKFDQEIRELELKILMLDPNFRAEGAVFEDINSPSRGSTKTPPCFNRAASSSDASSSKPFKPPPPESKQPSSWKPPPPSHAAPPGGWKPPPPPKTADFKPPPPARSSGMADKNVTSQYPSTPPRMLTRTQSDMSHQRPASSSSPPRPFGGIGSASGPSFMAGRTTATSGLLNWCQQNTQGFNGVSITNFTSSWKNGLAFAALVATFRPECINLSKISSNNTQKTLEEAFQAATKAKVAVLLDPEDVSSADNKSIITHLTMYHRTFAGALPNPEGCKKWNANVR